MNKAESGILKGIGIVMMLFHHLFVLPKDMVFIHPLVMSGDVPAVHKLAFVMSPVYLFLIISGYGYYKKFIAGDKPRRAHLISLFLKYWIILACFIMLGLLIGQYDVTELNIKTLFYNFSGYNCTINREVWFLLPFVCLCLCVNWLLNKYDCNPVSFLTLSAVTWFVASYVMSHYHFPLFIVFLLRVVYFTFPFLIGASLAKFRFLKNLMVLMTLPVS